VGQFSYVAVLVFVLVGSMWLEFALRTRVFKRPRRLLLTVLPVTLPFLVWDAYAISQGHWWFDTDRILGVYLPGGIPLDELLFFIVIPIASILTLEAVRSVRGWPAGDEIA
jgi:lycopene cyclase domain-containing protein